jgi:predicted solute-binding protein
MIAALTAEDRGDKALRDPALVDHYLSLYANADTAEMLPDARQGIEALFSRARDAGLLAASANQDLLDWAP